MGVTLAAAAARTTNQILLVAYRMTISLFRTQAKDLVRVLRSIDLKLGMEPAGKSIYRAAVGVVAGIGDKLIVERDFSQSVMA